MTDWNSCATPPTPKVIGFTHRQKCDLIGAYSLNCSMAQFDELAVILQQAALNAVMAGNGPAIEVRLINAEMQS